MAILTRNRYLTYLLYIATVTDYTGAISALICHGSTLDLNCKSDKFPVFSKVMYGRQNGITCEEFYSNLPSCGMGSLLEAVSTYCDGPSVCSLTASPDIIDTSNCTSTHRPYIELTYECQQKSEVPSQISGSGILQGSNIILVLVFVGTVVFGLLIFGIIIYCNLRKKGDNLFIVQENTLPKRISMKDVSDLPPHVRSQEVFTGTL